MHGYNKFENNSQAEVPQDVVVHQGYAPPQQMTIHVTDEPWGWGTVVMSVISFFCCQIFGMIAIVSSVTAYADHRVKDYAGARNKRNMACGFGVAAIVIGTLVVIGVIILFSTASAMIAESMQSIGGNHDRSSAAVPDNIASAFDGNNF